MSKKTITVQDLSEAICKIPRQYMESVFGKMGGIEFKLKRDYSLTKLAIKLSTAGCAFVEITLQTQLYAP